MENPSPSTTYIFYERFKYKIVRIKYFLYTKPFTNINFENQYFAFRVTYLRKCWTGIFFLYKIYTYIFVGIQVWYKNPLEAVFSKIGYLCKINLYFICISIHKTYSFEYFTIALYLPWILNNLPKTAVPYHFFLNVVDIRRNFKLYQWTCKNKISE